MRQYHTLLKKILEQGNERGDRTGTGTLSLFGEQIRFDLSKGFPAITTKELHFHSVKAELLWFLKGSTNTKWLKEQGVTIWDEWQNSSGNLGPIYGKQWVAWEETSVVPKKSYVQEIDVYEDVICIDSNKTVAKVGYNGHLRSSSDLHKMLYNTWAEMLHRCYNENRKHYTHYGAKGIHVDKEWWNFETFVLDVQKLEGWLLKQTWPDDYQLDKDFRNSNKYGPEYCVWLHKNDQKLNTDKTKLIRIEKGEDFLYETANLKKWCENNKVDYSTACKCLKGERKQTKGYTFTPVEIAENFNVRYRRHNQIRNVIANIRNNPNSRRHIVSAWNVAEVKDMALPPCHMLFQFYVNDGKLSCRMDQRSCDVFLGLPFNIASYALLTHMIAQCTGLGVGELIIQLGDVHIYLNHIEQVKQQLERTHFHAPTLWLDPKCQFIDDFGMRSIRLDDYVSWPKIEAEIAV